MNIKASNPHFNKIAIIGLGMIGSSIAHICKLNNISRIVSGFDSNEDSINFAIENNIIDNVFSFSEPTDEIDLLIIAAPLKFYKAIFNKISQKLNNNTLIIDIGSLKSFIFEFAPETLGDNIKNFVACHPIAGSEKFGVENFNANLLFNKKLIITPNNNVTSKLAIKKISLFWQEIGCHVQYLTPENHDKIYALVSHLPQLIAFLTREKFNKNQNLFLDKHFRLQNSNPKMWDDIFLINKRNITIYLKEFLLNISALVEKLQRKKYGKITYILMSKYINEEEKVLIVKRVMIVECFLEIKEIRKFLAMSGDGFSDFTFSFFTQDTNQNPKHKRSIDKLIEDNQGSLIEFFQDLQSKINKYLQGTI